MMGRSLQLFRTKAAASSYKHFVLDVRMRVTLGRDIHLLLLSAQVLSQTLPQEVVALSFELIFACSSQERMLRSRIHAMLLTNLGGSVPPITLDLSTLYAVSVSGACG